MVGGKAIFIILLISLSLFSIACDELIDEVVASAKVQQEAESKGKMALCPDDRPYRAGTILKGVCISEDELNDYTGIKLHGTEDELDVFIKTTKALHKGINKECPKEIPYYVSSLFGGKCLSKSDFELYLTDKEVIDEEDDLSKSCQYDYECSDLCEGKIKWDMTCNPRTKRCEKTYETDCSELEDIFGDYKFGKICSKDSCVRDTASISAQKEELIEMQKQKSDLVKELTAKKQAMTQLMLDTNKRCLNGLAEVTNKLIIDSALSLASPAKKLADVASDTTNALIEGLATDPEDITPEEFIAQNCKLYEALKNDVKILEAKIDRTSEEAKAINAQIRQFP